MLIGDLFERDVTRTIPPVVYFHEQAPEELAREVSEYIITGGYGKTDPRATEDGIHEQFLRLLANIRRELDKPEGPGEPASWISGFYGSGKSIFAKLLGLALDGRKLPDGKPLAEALLAQDHSPDADQVKLAWQKLVLGMKPLAVVFDIGSKARDAEHVHSVIVRQVQQRLGYSSASNLVAEYELKLEREGLHSAFMDKVAEVHDKPWSTLKDSPLSEDYFSAVLHKLEPDLFDNPMAWVDARSGSRFETRRSADEAVEAIGQMLDFRAPGCTLFVVVDEVSQYVHEDHERMLALQSFVEALKQRLKGRVWLFATGQHKLEEGSGIAQAMVKMKDRFPAALRVHLGTANIREVVHKRLLRKKKLPESVLREMFEQHRSELSLYAYRGDEISDTDFVEVYPMLPGHVDLLLDITTGLRSRSTRTQGDSHAIRGLLQLLGDLFKDKGLASYELGRLISIDLIYDVLQSALDSDIQMTLTRAFELCSKQNSPLMARVVKAVAMLELVQDKQKTSTELIARCLYDRLGLGNQQPEVQKCLDALSGESLVAYSEKTGYKIESSAGQEWQRERDGHAPSHEQRSAEVVEALKLLMGDVERPSLDVLKLPWLALFSDSVSSKDVHIKDERKHTVVSVDFQFTKGEGANEWVPRSGTPAYRDRIVWLVGGIDAVRAAADKLLRSTYMLGRYGNRSESLPEDRRRLLMEEHARSEAARAELTEAVENAFMAGQFYFRGRQAAPRDAGPSFAPALLAFGHRVIGDLYPNPIAFSVSEKDVLYLIENTELAAPPPVLGQDRLGILALDAGRYEVTCNGHVPATVLGYVKEHGGINGSTLLAHFGAPPHGVAPDVLRAAVVGLLRGAKLRIELPGVGEITSVRDEGVRELLKDTGLRKAKLSENQVETLSPRDRNAICALFKDQLGRDVARDNDAIADAVVEKFATVRERLTEVGERFRRLPRSAVYPETLTKLERALETCRKDRRVEPTVLAVKRSLNALRDGLVLLRRMENDLSDAAVGVLAQAENVRDYYFPALAALGSSEEARQAHAAIQAHLGTERAWEDTAELLPRVELVKNEYRARRRALLDAHASEVELAVERLKRRGGLERLDPDQRHRVLRHLREGTAADTDENAIEPRLEALEGLLAARREAAQNKALAELDVFLEGLGETPVVEVPLELSGREVASEAELERLIEALRRRVLHELGAHHRVRLK